MGTVHGAETVVDAIARYLDLRHGNDSAALRLLEWLKTDWRPPSAPAAAPLHSDALVDVLERACGSDDDLLADVGSAIRSVGGSLAWKVDDGLYYVPGAPISASYRDGNMHTVLAEGADFAMGLFLLTRHVDYIDHRHAAQEFYLNLTGPTEWRFDFGAWHQMVAGSVLWNESGRVHATRTGDQPWLAVWAWMGDTDQPCEVVAPADPSRRPHTRPRSDAAIAD